MVPAHVNRSRLLLLTKLRKQATRKRTSTTTTNITPIQMRQNSRRRLTGYHDHAKHTSATPRGRGTAETGTGEGRNDGPSGSRELLALIHSPTVINLNQTVNEELVTLTETNDDDTLLPVLDNTGRLPVSTDRAIH